MSTLRGTVLVLDDDRVVGRMAAAVAQSRGFQATCLDDPQAFIEAVRLGRPDRLVIDLVMPGMDGIEVVRALALQGCDAALVLTSGLGDRVLEAARTAAEERGLRVIGVLTKPFRPGALADLLCQETTCPRASRGAGPPVDADDLALALAAGQVSLVAQPKLDLATRRVVGAEVLSRWTHPEHGMIPPDVFVPLAENSGLMPALTHNALHQALAWFASSPLSVHGSVAVNLATHCLHDVGLADRVEALCREHRVAPGRLVLEITESSALAQAADCFDTITRLRLKGVRLSLDDFGTGYSSLSQLVRLPLSEIKIDRSFVARMRSSADAARIVHATLRLAKGMALACVAEGVEDADILEALAAEGCQLAQGYHISRPLPLPDFDRWFLARETPAAASVA